MNKIIQNIALAALFIVPLWTGGCNKDNDFYEVGRQPVMLTRPQTDTVIVLNHEHADSLYTFAWSSRRHFIDYKLRFGLDEQFTTSCERNPGVSDSWRLSTMQLDSVLSSMNVAVGATVGCAVAVSTRFMSARRIKAEKEPLKTCAQVSS